MSVTASEVKRSSEKMEALLHSVNSLPQSLHEQSELNYKITILETSIIEIEDKIRKKKQEPVRNTEVERDDDENFEYFVKYLQDYLSEEYYDHTPLVGSPENLEEMDSLNIQLGQMRLRETKLDREKWIQEKYRLLSKLTLIKESLKHDHIRKERELLGQKMHRDDCALNKVPLEEYDQAKKAFLKSWVNQSKMLDRQDRIISIALEIELLNLDRACCAEQLQYLKSRLAEKNLTFSYRNQKKSLKTSMGQLTFDSEGTEHSCRRAHWPGGDSGVTLGRGYDLKHRTTQQVAIDLRAAGFSVSSIETFTTCCGLKGENANMKVEELKALNIPDITLDQQKKLFELILPSYIDTVIRICTNKASRSVAKYGPVNWETLDPRIKEVLIDLTFVGHYVTESREHIQPFVVKNDFEGFKAILSDEALWTKRRQEGGIFGETRAPVAPDRFKRRMEFLNKPDVAQNSVKQRDKPKKEAGL